MSRGRDVGAGARRMSARRPDRAGLVVVPGQGRPAGPSAALRLPAAPAPRLAPTPSPGTAWPRSPPGCRAARGSSSPGRRGGPGWVRRGTPWSPSPAPGLDAAVAAGCGRPRGAGRPTGRGGARRPARACGLTELRYGAWLPLVTRPAGRASPTPRTGHRPAPAGPVAGHPVRTAFGPAPPRRTTRAWRARLEPRPAPLRRRRRRPRPTLARGAGASGRSRTRRAALAPRTGPSGRYPEPRAGHRGGFDPETRSAASSLLDDGVVLPGQPRPFCLQRAAAACAPGQRLSVERRRGDGRDAIRVRVRRVWRRAGCCPRPTPRPDLRLDLSVRARAAGIGRQLRRSGGLRSPRRARRACPVKCS